MGRRASQRAFDQIWMHFLLYSFTHYQEPILPILSHLQYLICTSHQSSGTDLGYTSFFFFGSWLREHRLTQFTQVQLFQVQALCIYNPGLVPCCSEKHGLCVCVGGCTGVKSVTTLWAGGGSPEAERQSGYSWAERVVRCTSTSFCTGCRQGGVMPATGPNPFQKYSVSSFL